MKIYDKEALLMVVFNFLTIALALWNFYSKGPSVFSIVLLVHGSSSVKNNIIYAFSEEDSQKRKKQVEKTKKAYKNVFGRFAPLAPFGSFIFLGIGLLLMKILPGSMLGVYVIICACFAPTFERIIIGDEIGRMEKEKE